MITVVITNLLYIKDQIGKEVSTIKHKASYTHSDFTTITYFILLLSSFIPLPAAMSVASSVHIRTALPIETIAVSQENVNLLAQELISNQFTAGEMAPRTFMNTFTTGGNLLYTAHLGIRNLNLVASCTGENLTVELTSLTDSTLKKTASLGLEDTILFERINNSYGSYSIKYLLDPTQEIPQETEVSYSLQPEI